MPNSKVRNPGIETYVKTKPIPFGLQVGFFAGAIWGAVRWISYYLGFTDVVPGFLVEPFFTHDYLAGTEGFLVGYAAFIGMSIVAAFLYLVLGHLLWGDRSKLRGPWPGVVFGVGWYVLLYLLVGPMVGMLPPLGVNDWDSIWFDGCLFLVWGLFIGYTITFEYTDERERDPKGNLLNLQ